MNADILTNILIFEQKACIISHRSAEQNFIAVMSNFKGSTLCPRVEKLVPFVIRISRWSLFAGL